MRVAHIVADTDAEGPGRRFAVWTQGCTVRCPGCCNPELFKATGGTAYTVEQLTAAIPDTVEGVSLLGGEPTEQPDLAAFCQAVRAKGLTVMLYSGLQREQIERAQPALLAHVDLLVDGPYDRSQPDDERRWIGSRNQRLHVLSDAYSLADPQFWTADTVEIRLEGGVVTVNGWPSAAQALFARGRG